MFRSLRLTPRIVELYGKGRPCAHTRIISAGSNRKMTTENHVEPQLKRDATRLHELSNNQKMFLYEQRNGTRFITVRLSLISRKPLSADVVQKSLMHLQRKNLAMQTVIRDYEKEKYFYKLKDLNMDFKVLEKGTSEEEAFNLALKGFDEVKGPLLRACMVPISEISTYIDPESKKAFPHQCHIYLYYHHSVYDGVTTVLLFQPLVDTINAVIEGENIDSSPSSVFVSYDEYSEAYSRIKEKLLSDTNHLERLKVMTLKSDQPPLFSRFFPRLEVTNPSTKFMVWHVKHEALEKFIAKCKNIGITSNTGFQMIVNTALVQLAQDAGLNEESYTLSTNYTVDLRRYLKPRDLPIHGCHIEGAASTITVDNNVTNNFWKNCHDLQNINTDIIKNGKFIEQVIGRQMFLTQHPPEDLLRTPRKLTRDFGLSNLRSVDWVTHGRGKHVKLMDVISRSVIHQFIFPFLFTVFSFKGVHTQLLSYSTEWMTEDDANIIAARIKYLQQYF